jgi:predicted nucleic acid-binding Zn ribbon protein
VKQAATPLLRGCSSRCPRNLSSEEDMSIFYIIGVVVVVIVVASYLGVHI